MKTVIISPYQIFVNGHALGGGGIRQYWVAKYLSEKGHDVTLVMLRRRAQAKTETTFMRIRTVEPNPIYTTYRGSLRLTLRKMGWHRDLFFLCDPYFTAAVYPYVKDADVVLPFFFGAAYPSLYASKLARTPIIFTDVDVECLKLFQFSKIKGVEKISTLGIYFLMVAEKASCNLADVVVVQRPEEEDFLRKIGVSKPVEVIPNGVDTDYFKPLDHDACKEIVKSRHDISSKFLVFFHGTLMYEPNVDALNLINQHIAPEITKKGLDVTFIIAGSEPPIYMKFHRNVRYIGFVRDLPVYINAADACIIPLRVGGGVSNKALEYLACGRPTVSTKVGVRGIEVENGLHCLVTEGMDGDFVNTLIQVLNERRDFETLGRNAVELAKERYSWSKIGERYEKVIKSLTSL